ncbi:MAG: hypothetical protein ACYS8Z_06635 [Planctomycetota bacterium]|jgi:hypothetical protein
MRRWRVILILVSVVVIIAVLSATLFGIRGELDTASLVGSYFGGVKVKGQWRRHDLELKADGTYIHRFTGLDGKKAENCGTWKLDIKYSDRERDRISFSNFVYGVPDLDEGFGGNTSLSVIIVRPLLRPVRIVISSDYDFSIVKQKSRE